MSSSKGSQETDTYIFFDQWQNSDENSIKLTSMTAFHVMILRLHTYIVSVIHKLYLICKFKIYTDIKILYMQHFMCKV